MLKRLWRRAEPHLTSDKQESEKDQDWFQAHSTQVFLIFGSILFLITIICIYCLSRGSKKPFLPKFISRRIQARKNKQKIKAKKRHRKSRNKTNEDNLISITSSTNGLLGNTRRSSVYPDPNQGYEYGYGYGYDSQSGYGRYGGSGYDMNAGKLWQGSHSLPPNPGSGGNKQLWRKTAYLNDLKKATEENSRSYNLRRGNNNDEGDFPKGWERVTRDTFYANSPTGEGHGHKRNTTISSFGHQPYPSTSSFYDTSSSPYLNNNSSYSVYDQNNLNKPISNYIPYTPISTPGEELTYPPNSKPPITNYRKSFISYMSNDPTYLEDLKSQGRRSQAQSRQSYYPKSPASTYVPPRTSIGNNRNSVYSYHSYDDDPPQSNYGYEENQFDIQYNQYNHSRKYNQNQSQNQNQNQNYQYDQPQNQYENPIPKNEYQYDQNQNQGYEDYQSYQNYSNPHYDQVPNYSQTPTQQNYLTPNSNPAPMYSPDQSIPDDTPSPYTNLKLAETNSPYTQLQPAENHPYTQLQPPPQTPRPKHERSPSIGSIKFPEPEPSPAPYTRSSTYSFPAISQQQSPNIHFRSSTQTSKSLGSVKTFDTYGYPTNNNNVYEDRDVFKIGNEDDTENNGDGDENGDDDDDPYSPSKTEAYTKLNSGNLYSPSLFSKSPKPNNRKSYIPSKISNTILGSDNEGDGRDADIGVDGRKTKRNSSGPSLSRSSNPNPSPNFPPPPMAISPSSSLSPSSSPLPISLVSPKSPSNNLVIDTSSSTLNCNSKPTSNLNSNSHFKSGSSEDSHKSTSSTITKRITRIKPPSLLKSTLPPKSPKSPSPLRYSSAFDLTDMPAWMNDDETKTPLPTEALKKVLN